MKKIIITLLALTMCVSSACVSNEKPDTNPTISAGTVSTEQQNNTNSNANQKNSKKNKDNNSSSNKNSATETNTVKNKNENNDNNVSNSNPEKAVLSTDYFRVTLPTEWYGKYTYEVIDGKHLIINHKKASESGYAGNLFSIELFTADEDYTVIPIHTYLNTIETKKGNVYDVVVVYPSDSQCSESLLDEYNSFVNQTEAITSTIEYSKDIKVIY